VGWSEWPKDILRHSFGSYHLAKFQNAALTAEIMGHKNARMLYKHYRDVIKNDEDVDAYWSSDQEPIRSEPQATRGEQQEPRFGPP